MGSRLKTGGIPCFRLVVMGMVVTLEEMKNYLRVDYEDDDTLLTGLIGAAQKLCMDVARTEAATVFAAEENARSAVMYAVAYL